MRVSLFVPCFVDVAAPQVAQATVAVLERLGCTVDYPAGQTCCGQPAWSAGARAECRTAARHFLDVFADSEVVVAPSGSCVGMVRKHYADCGIDDARVERVRELAEFIVEDLGVTSVPGAALPGRAAFHAACHQLRELRNIGPAEALLAAIDGCEVVRLESEQWCCGFGGMFSVTHPELSARMSEWKLREAAGETIPVAAPGRTPQAPVDWLVSPEASCLLQLQGVAERLGAGVRVVHLAEVLAGRHAPSASGTQA
jgi:L-lactate dehydrogenase complex protein LldE